MGKGKKFFMYLILSIASIVSVFPLYYMFCASTNKSVDVIAGKLIPGTYLIENYNREPEFGTGPVEFLPKCNGSDCPVSADLFHRRLWL